MLSPVDKHEWEDLQKENGFEEREDWNRAAAPATGFGKDIQNGLREKGKSGIIDLPDGMPERDMTVKRNPEKDEATIPKTTYIGSAKVIQNGFNQYEIDELTRAWGKIPDSHFEGLIGTKISNSILQYKISGRIVNGFYRNGFVTLTRQLEQDLIEKAGTLPKAIARVSYHEIGHNYFEKIFDGSKDHAKFKKDFLRAKNRLAIIDPRWKDEREFFADIYRGYLINDDGFRQARKLKEIDVHALMRKILGAR